jgi:hypothetical protein
MIETNEQLIAKANEKNAELRKNAFNEASQAGKAAERLAKLLKT